MSDQSQGEGWWLASDGKWYPPSRPDAPALPTTQPFAEPAGAPGAATYGPPTDLPVGAADGGRKKGLGRGPIIGIAAVAVVVVIVGAIAFFANRDDTKKDNASAVQSGQTDHSDQTDQSNQPQSAPPGFKVIKDEASGVSIAVPQNFTETDPSQFLDSNAQSDLGSENSDLAPFVSSGNALFRNSVLAASGSVNGTPAFVVVAKSPQRFDASNSDLASELRSELGTVGGSDVSVDSVALPAGPALRAQLTLEVPASSGSATVRETIYFVNVGSTTWVIAGVAVDGTAGSDLFDQIAHSFSAGS
jgi:hypothetical protein